MSNMHLDIYFLAISQIDIYAQNKSSAMVVSKVTMRLRRGSDFWFPMLGCAGEAAEHYAQIQIVSRHPPLYSAEM